MKTTKAQFDEFCAECNRLQPILGLMDWTISLKHGSDNPDAYAEVTINNLDRIAVVAMCQETDEYFRVFD